MADDGDIYVEHSQVGRVRVRIITQGDTAEADWYDYYGNSSVNDAWLSQAVASVRGGNWWRVIARHHAGNGHFSADLRQSTLDSLVEDTLTQKPLTMDAIDIYRLRRHVLMDALSMGWSDGISTTAYLCGAPLLCLACGKVGDFVERAPSRCETCNKTRMSTVG